MIRTILEFTRHLWHEAGGEYYYTTGRIPRVPRRAWEFIRSLGGFLLAFVPCALRAHPLVVDRSSIGPESGVEDLSCRCGARGFHHVYY